MKDLLDLFSLLVVALALDAVGLWHLTHRPRGGE